MTNKEKIELKDNIINIFNRFNILDHASTIGGLKDDILRYIDSMQEEPVSEDLQEAAMAYLKDAIKRATKTGVGTSIVATFEAGAQWQKEKMMRDSVIREVKVDAGGYPYIDATELYDYDKDVPLAKVGDKVRIVIINEV